MTQQPFRNDSQWSDVASFLEAHLRAQDRMLAPAGFKQRFPDTCAYSPSLTEKHRFDWVVVHKGRTGELHPRLLKQTISRLNPVFANQVFVVFSNKKELASVENSAPDLLALLEMFKKEEVKEKERSLNFRLGKLQLSISLGRSEQIQALTPDTADTLSWQLDQIMDQLKTLQSKTETSQQKIVELERNIAQLSKQGSNRLDTIHQPNSRGYAYLGDHRLLTQTSGGHKIYLDSRDRSLMPHILLDGYWEKWISTVFAEQLRQGMTVVDIGANVGYYTLLAAEKVGKTGRVYSFEANSTVFENLYQSVEVNGFLDRVVLENKAVYSASKQLKFHRLKYHHGGSTLVNIKEGFGPSQRDEVETTDIEAVSLDEYFADGVSQIGLIKIDAEGSEAAIFKGMKNILANNLHLKILFEYNSAFINDSGEDPRAFLTAIEEHGFQLKKIEYDATLSDISKEELLGSGRHVELLISK